MPTKHEYPQTILIELNTLSNLTAYILNEASSSNLLTPVLAFPIVVNILKYTLDLRCRWLMRPDGYMSVAEIEEMLIPINLPADYKFYLMHYCTDAIAMIEDMVSDFLDPYVNKKTWHLWRIDVHAPSISLVNDGDYRIHQWADEQERLHSSFEKQYPADILRRSH